MNILTVESYEQMSDRASELVLEQVREKPNCVLGLATGSTPVGTYERLAAAYQQEKISFAACKSINLDEYLGLGAEDEASYRHFMQENLFAHIDICAENTYLPDGKNQNVDEVCAAYDQLIADIGPIDLQILGIGTNGHIAFNEPDDHFVAGTHLVDLTEDTIEANQRFFSNRDEVPKQAYTMGMAAILRAKRILLLVSGEQKAEALYETLNGPITPQMPASILQLHDNVTVIADKEALGKF